MIWDDIKVTNAGTVITKILSMVKEAGGPKIAEFNKEGT